MKQNILEFPELKGTRQEILNQLKKNHHIELETSYRGEDNYRSKNVYTYENVSVTLRVKMDMITYPKPTPFGTIPAKYGNVRVIYKLYPQGKGVPLTFFD